MQRRQYLAAAASLTGLSLFAGCSGGGSGTNSTGGSSPTSGSPPSSTDTATGRRTATATAEQATTTGGLPAAPAESTPGTPAGEFTTSGASTPMDADPFVSTLESRIEGKNLMTGYVINTNTDDQVVELAYVADESNQRERMEAFAESFVETVRRTGGTGGWSLDMTVQTGAERNVWYTWEVTNELAIQRLTGEISREGFYSEIEATTATATSSG